MGQPSSVGVDVVQSLPLALKEKETEEKHLDDEMNGAAGTDPRINKQAAAREVGAVTGSPAAADPEMMEVDIEELEGPPRRPIFGFHNPTNYCHGIASLVAVLLPGPICGARATHAGELF
mgnify:CR=1 FL=1